MKSGFEVCRTINIEALYFAVYNYEFLNEVWEYGFKDKEDVMWDTKNMIGVWQPKGTKQQAIK